jgi:8-oxo-dGTP diphosphatase
MINNACGEYITLAEQQKLPKIFVSCGALIDADNKILICNEKADLWGFPGGKLEDNESPEYALVRELKEELNIDVHPSCLQAINFLSYSFNDFHLIMFLFICRKWNGNIIANENQQLRWVSKSQLQDYPTYAPNKILISFLNDQF